MGADLETLGIALVVEDPGQSANKLVSFSTAVARVESASQKMAKELENLQKSIQGINTGTINNLVESINRINGAVNNMNLSGSTAGLDSFMTKLTSLGDGSTRAASMIQTAARAIAAAKESFINLNSSNVG